MLDHRLSSSHFEDFRLSLSKDGLPSIPSYRSSVKPNKTSSKKIDSILSFDSGLTENIKPDKSKTILAPSEYSLKRNGEHNLTYNQRALHTLHLHILHKDLFPYFFFF
jgi:hypothetical protein